MLNRMYDKRLVMLWLPRSITLKTSPKKKAKYVDGEVKHFYKLSNNVTLRYPNACAGIKAFSVYLVKNKQKTLYCNISSTFTHNFRFLTSNT